MTDAATVVADPRANTTQPAALDASTGIAFGLVAASNLVQGAWATTLPWLNLTLLGVVLALPLAMLSLRHRVSLATIAALLMLVAAISLGFLEPALGLAASDKRVSLLISVLMVTVTSVLCLINSRRLYWFFGTIGMLGFIVLIGQVLAPDPLYLGTGRRTPTGLNSIGAGRAVGAALVICFGVALTVRRYRRWALLLICAPLSVGMVLAGGRGPALGVAVALVLMVVQLDTISRRTRAGLVVLAMALGLVAFSFLQGRHLHIIDGSDSGRSTLYKDAIRIAEGHPFGIGWGNFFRHAQDSLGAIDQGENLYAHNILLEFWIEAGFLGGLLFLAFTFIVLRHGLALRASPTGRILTALATSLFIGAMLSSDVIGNRMMWVSFAAILGFGGVGPLNATDSINRRLSQPERAPNRRPARGWTSPPFHRSA